MMSGLMMILAVSLSLASCSEADPADEGSKDPVSDLFDYSKMGGHPRLLLRDGDFDRMKEAISADDRLAVIHEAILSRADYHLTQGQMQYVKVGRRLLNESRRASERILFLAYSYKMTGDAKYLTKAENTINEVCLEGVPDLPVAPQDEAGLTTTFQTWPRGWFHIPKDPDFPVPS